MTNDEIIAGLRKLSEQGSQYRRTVCRLAADKLEQMQTEFKTIQEDGLRAVCVFDDIAPPGCENDCCFSWRGKEESEDAKVVGIDQFRGKLIDLMIEAKKADTEDAPFSEFLADFLIANGVTIATDTNVGGKWIPVTERLPEYGQIVLAFGKLHATSGKFRGTGNKPTLWWWRGNMLKEVTHWMLLPEPPKEG